MIVEALFWFHPLVWWIGARLVEERERACDEAVLRLGSKPHNYAEAILTICKSYLESPVSFVAGVTGPSLKKRIEAILSGRITQDLTFAKRFALTAAAIAALGVPVAVGIANTATFEEASINACRAFRKAAVKQRPGVFHSQCTTAQRLIQQAYGLFADGHWNPGSSLNVTGGPAWVSSDLYEIRADASNSQGRAMMNGPMLQRLLIDRFKLRFHRETKPVPAYALTIAAGGPYLQHFRGTCIPRKTAMWSTRRVSLEGLTFVWSCPPQTADS
jgi:hypothetical protein